MTPIDSALNNPVWHALTSDQASFALGDDLARLYPRDIGPFGAVVERSTEAYDHLADLIAPDETVVLVGGAVPTDEQWTLLRQVPLIQMVYDGLPFGKHGAEAPITSLTRMDVPTMIELVELTHPGPFQQRTIELGRYLSIWQEGQLAAMAGERMHLTGYREISAVCTHPAFQRRGYARQLIVQLITEILDEGELPFLHVVGANAGAQALYESMGFRRRAELPLLVLKRNPAPSIEKQRSA